MPSFKRTTSAAAVALSLWATPVSAEPVSTAIAAIGAAFGAGGIFAQGTVLGFLARTAASMALSALANALARRGAPKPPGIKTEATTSGGTEPQTIILGRYATAGHHAAPPYSGRHLVYVIDIADMPITGINRVIINEEYVDWEPSPSGNLLEHRITGDSKYVGSSPGAIVANFYDGTQTEADAFLLDRFGNHPTRPWQADMVGTGIAYAVMRFRPNRDVYSGLPRVRFEVDGAALYDPREDSSVGGDGPQRWDDPATWDFSQNPAVMIYNVFRGIALPDGTVWGYEFDADDLPLSNWFAAMNECDVPVDLDGGGTEPQYRAGIEVKIGPQDLGGDAPADIVEELLNACSAEIAEIGGTVKIRVGAPTLPVLFVTDDDIVVTSPDDYAPFPGLHETHNGVTATHPSPEALWEPVDAPPRYSADFEAEDADRRLVGDVTLNAVTSDTQVQRLMRAWVEDERRWRRHNITLSPRAAILEPLDTFEWTSERNGYLDKLFEARGVTHTRTLNQAVACRERDPSDYDWSSDFEFPVVLPDPASPLPDSDVPADWAAFPTVIKDAAGGDRRPAIRLIWTQGENTDATALEWQVRVAGQADLAAQGTTSDVALGEVIVSEGVLPGESYEARGRFVADRPMDWTAWAPVTTPDVRLGEVDFAQAVRDRLSTEQERTDEAAARHEATLGAAEQSVDELRDAAIEAFGPLDDVRAPLVERFDAMVPEQMSLEDRLETLAQQIGWGLSRMQQTDQRVSDAGIFTDPEAGTVKIVAFEYLDNRVGEVSIELNAAKSEIELKASMAEVNQAISEAQLDPEQIPIIDDLELRISDVEILADANAGAIELKADTTAVSGIEGRVTTAEADIDSLEGEISLKVDQSEFSDVETRLTTAEVQIDTLDGANITQTVVDTRRQFDEIDISAFSSVNELWASFAERQALREGIAFAQSQIYAVVNEGFEAEAAARLTLGAAIDGNTAAISSEQTARVTADEALAEDITQLEATVDDNSGAISTLQSTKVDAAGAVSAVTQEISADYGSLSALATATSFAEATADGVVSGHILRATGSGASARFEIVAGDNVGGPASSILLDAQNILLNGNTTVQGTFLTDVLAVRNEAYIDTANIVEMNVGTANIVGTLSAQRVSVDGITLERDGDDLIVNDGGIGTPKIVGGAVSETRFSSGGNSGGIVTSLSFTADAAGSQEFVALISGQGSASGGETPGGPTTGQAIYRVLLNGNTVRTKTAARATGQLMGAVGVLSDAVRFSSNSGTIEIEDISTAEDNADAQIDNAQITLLELKR